MKPYVIPPIPRPSQKEPLSESIVRSLLDHANDDLALIKLLSLNVGFSVIANTKDEPLEG